MTYPSIAVIGTAGRKEDAAKLDALSFDRMVNGIIKLVNILRMDTTILRVVSGGAAWADHVAVALVMRGIVAPHQLTVYMPTHFDGEKYIGNDDRSRKTADTANYYHSIFSKVIGRNSLEDIRKMSESGAVVVPGDGIFHNRNSSVARSVSPDGILVAFTFGNPGSIQPTWTAQRHAAHVRAVEAGLKTGGTADTWNKSRCTKYHVRLGDVLS